MTVGLLSLFLLTWISKTYAQDISPGSWPQRLGPATLDTQAGSLRLGVISQLLTSVDSKETDGEREESFGFHLRRIRLYPKASLLDKRLLLALQFSMAPNSLEVMDCYIDYQFIKTLQVRLGQYKVPFTRYRQQSFLNLLHVDWANVSSYFGAERQLGAMLHNHNADPRLEYALAVLSGNNARASHGVGVPLIYGETRPNPSNLVNPAVSAPWHPELFLRIAYNSPEVDSFQPSDKTRTSLRHTESLSIAWDMDPIEAQDFTARLSPEVMLKAYGFSLILGGYMGFIELTEESKNQLGLIGALFETAYRFDEIWEVSGRFSRVDVLKRIREDIRNRVDVLIEDADLDNLEEIRTKYQNKGQLKSEQEVTLGVNVYIVGTDLRWSTDVSWIYKDMQQEDLNDYRLRSQIQLSI